MSLTFHVFARPDSLSVDVVAAIRNIDITATILRLAGAGPTTFDLDGRIMPWGDKGASKKETGTVSHQLSEFWLIAEEEGKWANFNNTLIATGGCKSSSLLNCR